MPAQAMLDPAGAAADHGGQIRILLLRLMLGHHDGHGGVTTAGPILHRRGDAVHCKVGFAGLDRQPLGQRLVSMLG